MATPESGHWYDPKTGEPRHFIAKKDGSGNRPTTLADARKLALYPSVTQVLKVLAKPGLQNWIITQNVLAAVTTPRQPSESLDDFVARVMSRDAQAESEAARDLGTQLHEACEQYLAGLPEMVKPDLLPWIEPACKHLLTIGSVLGTEQILVGDGYAGKFDLSLQRKGEVVIVDLKTTGKCPDKAWKEHLLQLGAYAKAFQKQTKDRISTANMYISTKEKGKFVYCENGPWEPHWEVFNHLFEAWKFINEYQPGEEAKS